jgi:hypothetical protein
MTRVFTKNGQIVLLKSDKKRHVIDKNCHFDDEGYRFYKNRHTMREWGRVLAKTRYMNVWERLVLHTLRASSQESSFLRCAPLWHEPHQPNFKTRSKALIPS